MNALLTGVIGIVATLLGSFSTYLFQGRAAKRAEAFAREERLRQDQLGACIGFASALTELKRGLVTLWFSGRKGERGAEYQALRTECDRLGGSADAARFHVQLVSGDPGLMRLADSAFAAIEPIRSAAFAATDTARSPSDLDKLHEHENRMEAAVKQFIQAAASRLRAATP
ncbi:MAG: hypothetical protein ACM3ML_21520 [Micromonosporaceae bacterium]